jgi:phosphoribosyl 1,2-cyclic phosphate phosphodiesterase
VSIQITFLGTGTSHGVPMIGCDCRVCRSTDPRDKRWRPSVWLQLPPDLSVVIDTSADFRSQALAFGLTRLDAVLFTHSHVDHVFGLDETRRFNVLQRRAIPLFGDEPTLTDIRRIFEYAFRRAEGGHEYVPQLVPFVVGGPFSLGRHEVVPVPIWHGARSILGYRIGGFGYLTDCSAIPETSWGLLEDLDVLVLGALRERPHPSHFSVDQAVEVSRALRPRLTFFTHMSHDLGHADTCARLPAGMELAYDGLVVTAQTAPVSP